MTTTEEQARDISQLRRSQEGISTMLHMASVNIKDIELMGPEVPGLVAHCVGQVSKLIKDMEHAIHDELLSMAVIAGRADADLLRYEQFLQEDGS